MGSRTESWAAAMFGAMVVGSFVAVDPWGWDSFGPLRIAVVSTTALIGGALAFAAEPETMRRPPRWLTGMLAGFLLWTVIATAAAVDPWHAVVGTPDRHFGLITWVVLVVVAVAIAQHSIRRIESLLTAVVIAAGLAGAYVGVELAGFDIVERTFADGRLGGPFGQPAYLGAAMALALPVCVGWATDRRPGDGHIRRQRLVIGQLAAVGCAVGLLASQSRAAWVGVIAATVLMAWRQRNRLANLRPITRFGLVGAGLTAATMLAVTTPIGGRAASLFAFDGIADSRTDEWVVALRSTGAHPVSGTGPEGYRVVFGQHVDAAYSIEHGREVFTDRAHSSVLDVAVTTGVPGGLLYLGLVLAVCGLAWRAMASPRPLTVGAATGTVAYAIGALFFFPVAEIEFVFVAVAASLVPLTGSWAEVERSQVGVGAQRALSTGLVIAGLAAGLAGMLDVAADHKVAAALEPGVSPAEGLGLVDEARRLRPDSIRYDFIAARLASQAQDGEAALTRLADGLDTSPRDPAFIDEQVAILIERARQRGLPSDTGAALDAAQQRALREPNDPGSLLQLGIALALVDRNDEAITAFDRSAELNPTSGEPLFGRAVLLLQAGRLDEAAQAANDAAERDPEARGPATDLLAEIERRRSDG